jgi:hypothetical protein
MLATLKNLIVTKIMFTSVIYLDQNATVIWSHKIQRTHTGS